MDESPPPDPETDEITPVDEGEPGTDETTPADEGEPEPEPSLGARLAGYAAGFFVVLLLAFMIARFFFRP